MIFSAPIKDKRLKLFFNIFILDYQFALIITLFLNVLKINVLKIMFESDIQTFVKDYIEFFRVATTYK